MLVVCSDIPVLQSPLMSGEATRMQDLASEFSKIFRGNTPGPPQATHFCTHSQPMASGRARAQASRSWDPNLGPPQLFSRGWAPGIGLILISNYDTVLGNYHGNSIRIILRTSKQTEKQTLLIAKPLWGPWGQRRKVAVTSTIWLRFDVKTQSSVICIV